MTIMRDFLFLVAYLIMFTIAFVSYYWSEVIGWFTGAVVVPVVEDDDVAVLVDNSVFLYEGFANQVNEERNEGTSADITPPSSNATPTPTPERTPEPSPHPKPTPTRVESTSTFAEDNSPNAASSHSSSDAVADIVAPTQSDSSTRFAIISIVLCVLVISCGVIVARRRRMLT